MGTKLTRQLENQGMGNRTGTKTERKWKFAQKAACRMGRNETIACKDLVQKISKDDSGLMTILFTIKGAR